MEKRKINLLVVDDDEVDRMVYRRHLLSKGDVQYFFHEAETLDEGYDLFLSGVADCILLDYMLADTTGIEFLEKISNSDGKVTVPVVMLTGQGSEKVAVAAMKHGVKDYLVKGDLKAELLHRAVLDAIGAAEVKAQEAVSDYYERMSIPAIKTPGIWTRV